MLKPVTGALVLLLLFSQLLSAQNDDSNARMHQENSDTTRAVNENMPAPMIEEQVVTGERTRHPMRTSTTATGVLTAEQLQALPVQNLKDALQYAAGITFVEQDASGHLPMAVVRGFFGGGEAEYILMLVDGIPVNDLRSGLINWNLVPYHDIERIEISRGGGSAVYGDLALGAVIDISTRRGASSPNRLNWAIDGGQYSNLGGDIFLKQNRFAGNINYRRSDGYRDHSAYQNAAASGQYYYRGPDNTAFTLRGTLSYLDKQDPGPLGCCTALEDRRDSNELFADDRQIRRQADFSLSYFHPLNNGQEVNFSGGSRFFERDQTRTLQLTSELGDSQFEDQRNLMLWGQLQYRHHFSAQASGIAGVALEWGGYDSKYFSTDRTSLLSSGEGHRLKSASFLEGEFRPVPFMRMTAGLRGDRIDNRSETGNDLAVNQLSPRIGINLRYSGKPARAGHLYLTYSRAFKAPTLDQLYDTRRLNFFGQEFNFANNELKPQRSNNYDLGIYQALALAGGRYFAEVALSAYLLDIDDEIDLDLATFRYGNILKSRHSGFEGSLGFYMGERIRFHHVLNVMEVTFESGEFKGNRLKHIPQTSFTNRLQLDIAKPLKLVLGHKFFGEVFLDDANSDALPAFQVFDGQFMYDFSKAQISVMVQNILDEEYISSGYLLFDAILQQNVRFFYPARGRFLQVGLRFSR